MQTYQSRFRCFAVLLLCILCSGCGKGKKEVPDLSSYVQYDFQSISEENIKSYAIQEDGEILVCTAEGKLVSYDSTGQMLTTKVPEGAFYECLCYDGEKLYAYDWNQSAIVELTNESARIIETPLRFHTIRNIVALDGKLYVLAILQTPENEGKTFQSGIQDFEDYGEAVYCIDAENGKYEEISLDHVVAEYRTKAGGLYFYGWQEDKYYLYQYDPAKNKVMSRQNYDGMGNLNGMVIEGNHMFGMAAPGLFCIDLNSGKKETLSELLYTPSANLMQFSEGNLFIYEPRKKAILQAAFLGQDGRPVLLAKETAEQEKPAADAQLPQRTETITVSQLETNLIKPLAVKSLSGLATKAVKQPLYEDELIMELMAGNEKIDIYLFSTSYGITRAIREMEYYVPLNDSERIMDYLDRCFSPYKEAAIAKNGDVWMFPINATIMTTWYIPENMEHFQLTEENLDTAEHYLNTLGQLQGKLGNYRFYNYTTRFIMYCDWQYDLLYNDYENGSINFQTETYRNLMEPLWTGWVRNTGYEEHPLFFNGYQEPHDQAPAEGYINDRSRVIFKTDWLNMVHPVTEEGALEGWRVMAAPKISDPAEKQAVGLFYMLVNPYSKQKEAAIAYLEAITADPLRTVTGPSFLLKEKEAYAEKYDITQPAFLDLMKISENAKVRYDYTLNTSSIDYITPYQEGKITIEQALEQRQRMAEAWLEE